MLFQSGPIHRPCKFFCYLYSLIAAGLWVARQALEPSTPLANYGRQTWGMENGLP